MAHPEPKRPVRRHKKRTGSGGAPGPLQRQVLRVLHGAKLLADAPARRTTVAHLTLIAHEPVSQTLRDRFGRGLSAKEIARILSDVIYPDGTQRKVHEGSVSAAMSGMMVNDGRYWVSKHPYNRWAITRNGIAWL